MHVNICSCHLNNNIRWNVIPLHHDPHPRTNTQPPQGSQKLIEHNIVLSLETELNHTHFMKEPKQKMQMLVLWTFCTIVLGVSLLSILY